MTAEEMEALIQEVVDTLRRLRVNSTDPKPPRSNWPTPVQDYWASYGRHAPRVRLAPPSPASIDRMDYFMPWLLALMREARSIREGFLWVRIVLARGHYHSFQKIADMASHVGGKDMSKSTAARIYATCLDRLTKIANRSLAA